MHKTKKFVGQPIFAQLIRIIPKHVVANAVRKHKSDRYYKALPTNAHLISILYGVFGACDSARALCENLTACFRKLNYFGLKKSPAKSTLSDANSKRDHRVFETIYFDLVKHYRSFLSDSRTIGLSFKELFIIDSTTIQLFSNILKGAGRNPKDGGKKKGGLKVHTLMDAAGDFARFVKITSASANDLSFLKQIPTLPPGSCVVFDKASQLSKIINFGQITSSSVNFMRFLWEV